MNLDRVLDESGDAAAVHSHLVVRANPELKIDRRIVSSGIWGIWGTVTYFSKATSTGYYLLRLGQRDGRGLSTPTTSGPAGRR